MQTNYALVDRVESVKTRFADPRLSRKLVLVLGCQRGGTTLLYMILSAHKKIAGKDESEVDTHYPLEKQLKVTPPGSYLCFKLPTRTGDIGRIKKRFPHSHVAWLVRDPISTVSSMRGLVFSDGTPWLDTAAKFELESLSSIFPEVAKLDIEKLHPVEIGAYVWKYKMHAYELFKQEGFNVSLVYYEDLVKEPQKALSSFLEKLNLSWDKQMEHHEEVHKGSVFWGENIGDKPLDPSRIKPKKLHLNPEEVRMIADITEKQRDIYYPSSGILSDQIRIINTTCFHEK